jgi:hypothetical protein
VIPVQFEGVVIARLKRPLGVENDVIELTPEAQVPKGLYIARTVAQDCREIPARVLNAALRDQMLTTGTLLAHFVPVTLVPHPMLNNHRSETLPRNYRT